MNEDELIRTQDLEFRTEFENANHLLHSAISDTPEAELLAAGERLISSDVASRRILGIRLLRELRELTEEATSDMAALLRREHDDDVIYWIASAFGFLKSDSVTSELVSLATHEDPGVRYHVATGSWWQADHDPRIEATLRNALADGDPRAVRAARDALGESGESGESFRSGT